MNISVDELVRMLEGFQHKCEEYVVHSFKEETPVANTGDLKRSIRVLRSARNEYSIIGTDLYYAEPVTRGGKRGVPIPDYYGNRKSVHRPQNSDVSTPRLNGKGRQAWTFIRNARANPFDKRTFEGLQRVNWNSIFWDENGEFADFE